uniref:Time for coffee n=1 Tax=Chenopodium quinoa TaxID=63459 RepID=A0A803N0Z6_CHEQI
MMDRNREARRAAAMTNGLPRRRHRTTTGGGSLRESPVRYVPPSNPVPISSTSGASTLTSHRKSFPPPSRVLPTWKAPDEMIGVSIPRKARSASTKRGHDCWSSAGGVGGSGEQISRQPSSSPVRSTMTATPSPAVAALPTPLQAQQPMSPSSSNISIKKKIKAANGPKQQRPPKSSSKSSPSTQDAIEIEVAEVLYGLMKQSQAPSKQDGGMIIDSAKMDSRSITDSKSRVSSPVTNSPSIHHLTNCSNPSTSSSTAPPLTTVAPKRKRPRPYPEDIPTGFGPRSSPISSTPKPESDQAPKLEAASSSMDKNNIGSAIENGGDSTNLQDLTAETPLSSSAEAVNNGILSDAKQGMVEESSTGIRNGMMVRAAKVEEASSSSPKLESPHTQNHDRVESSTTNSTKPNSSFVEQDNHREDKYEIDLMVGSDGLSMGRKPRLASSQPVPQQLNLNSKDIQFDLEKCGSSVNEDKLNFQKQQPTPPKTTRDDANTDKPGGQLGSAPLPMSVPGGWHGGLPPMGYVGPLQGVVSMDGTPMASPPIQSPHFLFSQPRPKRCATHCYIARSISVHQQMMKMNPFWPAAAATAVAGTSPLFGAKPYNLNMVPPADLAAAAGRGMVVSSSQDNKGQPFTFFPGQSASSTKDKSPQPPNAPDSAQKKQYMLQPALPPGAPSNMMHGPALFFPMGQQQAAVANARPNSTKSPSTGVNAASASAATSSPMGAAPPTNSNAGPAMSFSYPNMGGNEAQFMAILGNRPYPFPIPAHVGAAPPYRGSHPQPMSFYNGSFYSSQMLHPSQMQQQQAVQPSQSMQIQQQNQQNASLSTASSSSQKHLQNQQQRPQGSSAPGAGNPNQGLQIQAAKGRMSQTHPDMGGEDSPSTADSRNRPNMNVYGQNFAMPFHSPNFAMMTPPSSMGSNAAGVPNGNLGDKKQQPPQQPPAFPMSFATMNGAATPGLDMSSIAHNHALMQTNAATDPSNADEERKAVAARASAASAGQSIAFSREFAENSMATMPGNNVVDTSARSLNMMHGSSGRPTRSPGPNSQQYVAPSAGSGRSKTPTSNGNVYPDHLNSSSIMAAKFPNSLSGFPPLVQTSGGSVQSQQWKNSVRPNTPQVSSPSVATSTASNMKNLPQQQQQQGRSQQNHTQISFGANAGNSKTSSTSQGQQNQHNNQGPSSPMMVGSPSNSSVSKGASGSPRTTASASTGNKAGAQGATFSSQQGKNSQSPSLSSQKPSILGSPHIMSSSSNKPQMQQSQQQPQLSKQSIQQAQLFFSNAYMQASVNTSAAMANRPPTSSSGMLSLCTPASLANTSTSDPAKAVAAAAFANNMKGGLPSQGMYHAAQFAAQSAGGAHQLMPAGFPYVHAVSTAVQVKPSEQKQPAGE